MFAELTYIDKYDNFTKSSALFKQKLSQTFPNSFQSLVADPSTERNCSQLCSGLFYLEAAFDSWDTLEVPRHETVKDAGGFLPGLDDFEKFDTNAKKCVVSKIDGKKFCLGKLL